jgi:hypothetical protein
VRPRRSRIAAEHAGDLVDSLLFGKALDMRYRSPACRLFIHPEMMVGVRGDLVQV